MGVRNQNGFSLLEVMLVLFIVAIISSLSFLSFESLWKQKKVDHFFEKFEKDMLYTQLYAINHEKQMNVFFQGINSTYLIKESGFGKVITTRKFGPMVEIEQLTMQNPITFLQNGNIRKPGRLLIHIYDREFTITFLLGKGRFYVTEL